MMDFDTFLDVKIAKLIPDTLPTLNLSIKSHPSSGSCVFPDVISVSNYHSYKEETIKLLPYHSFYEGHINPRKIEPSFLAVCLKKNTKPPGFPFSSILPQNFKLHLS